MRYDAIKSINELTELRQAFHGKILPLSFEKANQVFF